MNRRRSGVGFGDSGHRDEGHARADAVAAVFPAGAVELQVALIDGAVRLEKGADLRSGDVQRQVAHEHTVGLFPGVVVGPRVGEADENTLPAEHGAVQGLEGRDRAITVRELDEAHATRLAGVNVEHHFRGDDLAERAETLDELGVSHVGVERANVQIRCVAVTGLRLGSHGGARLRRRIVQ